MTLPGNDSVVPLREIDVLRVMEILAPMLLVDERDPKLFADTVLLDEESLIAIMSSIDLSEVDERTRSWLLVSAIYTGAPALRSVLIHTPY